MALPPPLTSPFPAPPSGLHAIARVQDRVPAAPAPRPHRLPAPRSTHLLDRGARGAGRGAKVSVCSHRSSLVLTEGTRIGLPAPELWDENCAV